MESWWNCNYVHKLQQGVYQVQDDISMISTRSGLLDQSITNSMAVLKRLLYLQRSKFYLLRMHHAGEVLRPHLSLPYSPLPQGVSATPPFLPHYSLKLFYSQPKNWERRRKNAYSQIQEIDWKYQVIDPWTTTREMYIQTWDACCSAQSNTSLNPWF
jgi:hypothetical protein